MEVRDFGRGIPLGKMVDAVSIMNTGGKYDSKHLKIGRVEQGWGESCQCLVIAFLLCKVIAMVKAGVPNLCRAKLQNDSNVFWWSVRQRNLYLFCARRYAFSKIISIGMKLLRPCCVITPISIPGWQSITTEKRSFLKQLARLLNEEHDLWSPCIRLFICRANIRNYLHTATNTASIILSSMGHTTQGGTHQSAFREAVGRTIKEFYNKTRNSPIFVTVLLPLYLFLWRACFESQTKTNLVRAIWRLREDFRWINLFQIFWKRTG